MAVSIITVLLGGLAFDTPVSLEMGSPAPPGTEFQLYPNRQATQTKIYRERQYFKTYLNESIRGLSPGAPVEYRGFKLGEVIDVRPQCDC